VASNGQPTAEEIDRAECLHAAAQHLIQLFNDQQPNMPRGDPFGDYHRYVMIFRDMMPHIRAQSQSPLLRKAIWRGRWQGVCMESARLLEDPHWGQLVERVEQLLDAHADTWHDPHLNPEPLPTINAADVIPLPTTWLWKPYFPKNAITGIDGEPGVGKSYLALCIAADLSQGRRPGPMRFGPQGTPQYTLWCTGEEDVARTLIQRLGKLGADQHYIEFYNGLLNDDMMLSHLGRFEATLQQLQPAFVVIDPLVAFIEGDKDINRANTRTHRRERTIAGKRL